MRFRSVLKNCQSMRDFQNIIITISKLAKNCIMEITPTGLCLITNEELGDAVPVVWAEINAEWFFNDYHLECQNLQSPKIMLMVSTAHLVRAFPVSRYQAQYCKLKLTNVGLPNLSVKWRVVSPVSGNLCQIMHNVPVTVIPISDWTSYPVPRPPVSTLVLNIPFKRVMRRVLDKMKNLSSTVIMCASSKGELTISAQTNMLIIATSYQNLEKCRPVNVSSLVDDPYAEVSCTLHCKKFANFLAALQNSVSEILCGTEEQTIYLEAKIREGSSVHTIIPAISS